MRLHEDFIRCPRLIKSGGTWKLLPPSGDAPNMYQHPAPLPEPEPVVVKPVIRPGMPYRKEMTQIPEMLGPFLPKAELARIEAKLIMPRILDLAAEVFDVSKVQFTGRKRMRRYAWPRQAVMVFLADYTEWSLPMIGRAFKRDHTTIIHATKVIDKHMEADKDYADLVEIFNDRARKLLEGAT